MSSSREQRPWLLPLVCCLAFVLAAGGASAQAPAAAPEKTAAELLAAGEAAYNQQDWTAAAAAFDEFMTQYSGIEGSAEAVRRVRPLLALCQVRLQQFDTAEKLITEALADPKLDPALRTDLRFFAGLAACRTSKFEEARRHLGALFADPNVDPTRRMESLVLGGLTYVMEENWPGAITFFTKYGKEIRAASPEAGGRADILHLHALMKAERWDEAIVLSRDIYARRDEVRQVVTFASLLIELGSHFLEQGQHHKAIAVLRLVPARAEIVQMQNTRLNEGDADLEYARAGGNTVRVSQLTTSLVEMKKDMAAIEALPQFDSSSRLRLAQAYFSLGRIREASLILDQMVRQMDPDPVVESATANLIAGWMSLERWNRAARAADVYLERLATLPETKNLPGVLFARAQALEGMYKHADAAAGYADVAKRFPQDELAPRARFMEGYNVLQQENYAEAGRLLDSLLQDINGKHEMWDHAFFWRGMTFYFDQKWGQAREHLADYLDRVNKGTAGSGEYVDDAMFRRGYAFFSEALYEDAIRELEQFENEHRTSEWLAEAQLTLGDCYGALGELEKAKAAYQRIDKAATGFHDEGWMKRGQIFKALKDLPGMKTHYAAFLQERPDSPRITEALQWLGWVAKQEGRLDEARQIYWDAIRRFGNDNARPALEDIFIALGTFYPGDQKQELRALFQEEKKAAESKRQTNYAVRLGWAEAQLALKSAPEDCRAMLAVLGDKIEPKDTAPRVIIDCAEAQAALQNAKGAERLFDGLRKWYPRAPERDRAYAGLGFLALTAGDETRALDMFDRFEKTAVMPKSAPDANGISIVEAEIGGKVALARARLLEGTKKDVALSIYKAVQKSKAIPSKVRAEAFIAAASLLAQKGQAREALPYYEQVYVLFNRYPDLVAKAYWGRGQALEKLGKPQEAREVYSELALRQDLSGTPQANEGRQRAMSLGGVIEPKMPEGGEIPPMLEAKGKGGAP